MKTIPTKSLHNASHALVLTSLLALMSARAQDAAPIELRSPNPVSGGAFGNRLTSLPDLTGDGVGELWVAATYETVRREINGVMRTYSSAGRAYVFNGASAELLYSVESPEPGADRHFTFSADSAGDLNGDGIEDLMAGDAGAANFAGKVHFFDGSNGTFLFSISSPNPMPGISALGSFGTSVQRVPDMTGDGRDDWLITQPHWAATSGTVYVFDSQTKESIRAIRLARGGGSVFGVPDVDGDGMADILVADPNATVRRDGRSYSMSGSLSVLSGATGARLYELLDPEPGSNRRIGSGLRGIGDIDGDQIGDFAIGSHFADNEAGTVLLFSGKDGHWIRTLQPPVSRPSTWFGGSWEFHPLPDLNGDAKPELWVNHLGLRTSYVFDGANGALLKEISYPPFDNGGSRLAMIRKTGGPGIHGYAIAENLQGDSGRVYLYPFSPLPPKPRLRAMGLNNDGFRLEVVAEAGLKLQIDTSSDFQIWKMIGNVTTGETTTEFIDTSANGEGTRFYRFTEAP